MERRKEQRKKREEVREKGETMVKGRKRRKTLNVKERKEGGRENRMRGSSEKKKMVDLKMEIGGRRKTNGMKCRKERGKR